MVMQGSVSSADHFERMREAMRMLRDSEVLVGVPEAKTERRKAKITNAQLLYIHTHGIRKRSMRKEMDRTMNAGHSYSAAFQMYIMSHGSPLWKAPPRPVLEPAIDAHKAEIAKQMKDAATAALGGNEAKARVALKRAGMVGQNAARSWFTDQRNGWAPNSPVTIALKGSSRPLIDTGQLRRSIVYVVRKRGGDSD